MPEEIQQPDVISPEIQEVMRNLVAAIRAVKLYPPNNPIYAQSVHKAFESLDAHLRTGADFTVGVQKTNFLYEDTPVGKETQINRSIAQDLFAKGIREVVFLPGLGEDELVAFCQALALMPEEMAMQSGIVSILWERSVTHIKVTEAMLEEVVATDAKGKSSHAPDEPAVRLDTSIAGKELHFKGRTLVLGEMMEDSKAFSSKMLEIAQQTIEEGQTVEDRLYELYQEAGQSFRQENAEDQEALFRGLAKSVLEMDDQFRDKFISSKLYAHLDAQKLREEYDGTEKPVPEELHEIVSGRFSKEWSVQQVASLLKKSSRQQREPKAPSVPLSQVEATAISEETIAVAQELTEYTADEMEALRAMGEVGTESDITEAAVRTLIFLLPMVRNEHRPGPPDKEQSLFAGVVHQLETMLDYLLKKKEYDLATLIVRAFHLPLDNAFRPRLQEAIAHASSRGIIGAIVTDIRKSQKGSPAYRAAYAYLSVLGQEATTVLLEALAVEQDRAIRRYLLDILKELGRNQISMIGQRVSDGSWYVVRNVVNILAESRSEEALVYLEKAMGHKQIQIRHEVIKGLIAIGGGKAAELLARFLKDKDFDIQLQTLRGMSVIHGAGTDEARVVQDFLSVRHLNRKENELSVEGIRSLAKIGDAGSVVFLKRYSKRRWWKSRKLQEELRSAAMTASDAIQRRLEDGGRTS